MELTLSEKKELNRFLRLRYKGCTHIKHHGLEVYLTPHNKGRIWAGYAPDLLRELRAIESSLKV